MHERLSERTRACVCVQRGDRISSLSFDYNCVKGRRTHEQLYYGAPRGRYLCATQQRRRNETRHAQARLHAQRGFAREAEILHNVKVPTRPRSRQRNARTATVRLERPSIARRTTKTRPHSSLVHITYTGDEVRFAFTPAL